MKKIILASQSPQRKLVFASLGLDFEIIPADIDEKSVAYEDVSKRAENIARAKAELVAENNPEAIVIAADTFSIFNGRFLEKPVDEDEAKQMLRELSGQSFESLTGYCYLDKSSDISESGVCVVEVTFRELSDSQIDHYVKTQPVTTWAAAFSPAYHEGAALLAHANGSFTGLTHGLPMEKIVPLLERSGVM